MIFQDEDSVGSYWEAEKEFLYLSLNEQSIKEGSKKVNDHKGNSGPQHCSGLGYVEIAQES